MEVVMSLKLVKLDYNYRKHLLDMMDEWSATGEKIVPYSIRKNDYRNFDTYWEGFANEEQEEQGHVPATTLFCLDVDRDIFVGAVNIRHYLNEALLLNGGHIGDGIRPSERRKGYATKMIALALEVCRSLGINKVLMVCDKYNIGSAKSIINNGGILENEIEVEGIIEQRYWIDIIGG
jgi:predicted acetyltransferase